MVGGVFSAYWTPLMAVPSFNCLGQTHLSSDNNWLTVEHNLRWERGEWGILVKLLGGEGSDRITAGYFMWWWYKRCFCLVHRRG